MILHITAENFHKAVEQTPKPVVLDIYADWCGPCQQMAPIFEELANDFQDTYIFAKLNVDESRELAIKLGVSSLPTFLFLKKGVVVGKVTGYLDKHSLKHKIEEQFNRKKD
ncbi:MAG: thioredoxin [Candidatus Babeliales bacterium]